MFASAVSTVTENIPHRAMEMPAQDRARGDQAVATQRCRLPVGARNPVTSCDVHILVHQAAKSVASEGADDRPEGRGSAAGGWVLIKRSVWAVGVVVLEILPQHGREVPRPDDQQAVEGIRGAACLSSVRRSRSPAVPGPGCG